MNKKIVEILKKLCMKHREREREWGIERRASNGDNLNLA